MPSWQTWRAGQLRSFTHEISHWPSTHLPPSQLELERHSTQRDSRQYLKSSPSFAQSPSLEHGTFFGCGVQAATSSAAARAMKIRMGGAQGNTRANADWVLSNA